MKNLLLFAASKDQKKYFDSLASFAPERIQVWWYKKSFLPAITLDLPMDLLSVQIEAIFQRKKNLSKNLNKSPFYWSVFKFFKWLEAIFMYWVFLRALKKYPQTFIGIWNGKKFRQAILVIAVKKLNKKTLFFETGPLPGYSAIDPRGVDFYSSLPRDISFYKQHVCSEKNVMALTENITDMPLPKTLPKSYVFVPFQVVEDSNIYLHSPWINNMNCFYSEIENIAKQFPEINFVIKEHPACPEIYTELHKRALLTKGQIRFVENVSTDRLVSGCSSVLTINSTVGMEALMARKKLIVIGQAIFGFSGLAKVATTREELEKIFKDIDNFSLDKEAINQYFCFVKYQYAVAGDAMKSPSNEHFLLMLDKIELMLAGKVKEAIGCENINE